MTLRNTFYVQFFKTTNLKCCLSVFFICIISGCKKNDSANLNAKYLALYEEAVIEWKNLNIGESNALFLELLSIADRVKRSEKNKITHLRALNFLGDISLRAGEKKLAYKEFEQALSLAEKYNNETYQVLAKLNMVRLEEEPKEVERILQETKLEYGSNEKNKFSLDQIKYALGLLYAKNERIEDALNIFNDLLLEDYPDKEKSYFYKGLGISYRNKGNFKSAIVNFDKALELSDDVNKLDQLNILVERAKLYLLSESFDTLNVFIKNIKPTIDTIGDINLKKRICELQLDLYNKTDNDKGKLQTLEEMLSLKDKSSASLGSIAVNLKNYELKKQKETEINKRNFLIVVIALIALLFLSWILSLFLLQKNSLYKNQIVLKSISEYIDVQEAGIVKLADYLHDVINADLAALKMHINILGNLIPKDKLTQIQSILKDIIEKIRELTDEINPKVLANEGLIAAIKEKALKWSCNSLNFTVESNVEKIPFTQYNLEFKIYSCITECLNNIVRHSEASEASITFNCKNGILHNTIKDNGIGFDTEKFKGRMEHTIKNLGGEFQIQSKKNEGTSISIKVPFVAEN